MQTSNIVNINPADFEFLYKAQGLTYSLPSFYITNYEKRYGFLYICKNGEGQFYIPKLSKIKLAEFALDWFESGKNEFYINNFENNYISIGKKFEKLQSIDLKTKSAHEIEKLLKSVINQYQQLMAQYRFVNVHYVKDYKFQTLFMLK